MANGCPRCTARTSTKIGSRIAIHQSPVKPPKLFETNCHRLGAEEKLFANHCLFLSTLSLDENNKHKPGDTQRFSLGRANETKQRIQQRRSTHVMPSENVTICVVAEVIA